jgi:hypothetical protein
VGAEAWGRGAGAGEAGALEWSPREEAHNGTGEKVCLPALVFSGGFGVRDRGRLLRESGG